MHIKWCDIKGRKTANNISHERTDEAEEEGGLVFCLLIGFILSAGMIQGGYIVVGIISCMLLGLGLIYLFKWKAKLEIDWKASRISHCTLSSLTGQLPRPRSDGACKSLS